MNFSESSMRRVMKGIFEYWPYLFITVSAIGLVYIAVLRWS